MPLRLENLPFRNGDRILFQGDSITDVGRNREDPTSLGNGYVSIIRGVIAGARPDLQLEIINRGISGNRTPELLERWDEDCIALQPSWLSIMIGVNDVWRLRTQHQGGQTHVPLPDFTANYRQLLDQARSARIPHLVLVSPTLIDKQLDSDLNQMLGEYDLAVQELAREYSAIYVPLRQRLLEVITTLPQVEWLRDGCHPNTVGHALLASVWLETVAAI